MICYDDNHKIKIKYGLERHLEFLSTASSSYKELYSYWILVKKELSKELDAVTQCYPYFSLHDASHSERIIKSIELMLGEERIKLLSATDTWLILECAYSHDIGMVIPIDQFESDIKSLEENDFMKLFG